MYKSILIALVVLISSVSFSNSLADRQKRGNEKNKNYDICSRVFDVSNSTIIKTTDSLKNGAKYLGAVQATTRDACERNCCSTDSCNVAVLEEKSKTSADGDCFLFDCGSLDDFKCIFAVHASYVSLGMMVNRVDLEKTRIHEQAKHEMDLKILKTPAAAPAAIPQSPTTLASIDRQQQQPYRQQSWLDDPQEQQQQSMGRWSNDNGGVGSMINNQLSNGDNGGPPMYDYSQQQQPQQQPLPPQRPYQPRRPPIPDGQMQQQQQQNPLQYQQQQQQPMQVDSAARSYQSTNDQQQDSDRELQRKRPPVGDNPAIQAEKISKPKGLMDSRIDQPQRPPIYSEQQMSRQSGKARITCHQYQWQCASGDQCVAIYDRCSGIVQCNDGSDEQNCDQVQPAQTYDTSANQQQRPAQQQLPPIQQQKPVQQSQGSPGNYQNGYQSQPQSKQQNPAVVQSNPNSIGDQRGQQQQQQQQQRPPPQQNSGYIPHASQQQQPNGQRTEFSNTGQVPQQANNQPSQSINSNVPSIDNIPSPKKEPKVEFISIQKLDSSAPANGGESASLAMVMLGLGMALLAMVLLFLSCRMRKMRRRIMRRGGKVVDTEEGEFLVNGMYL